LNCSLAALLLAATPTELLGMDKEERFEAMTALIAEKVGVPVSDCAADDAARHSQNFGALINPDTSLSVRI